MKGHTMTTNPNQDADAGEMLDTLVITRVEPRNLLSKGTWVEGTMAGHRFEALVFPEHAANPDYELGESRISKLWIQRIEDRVTVYNWDRGADIEPATTLAGQIVDLLAAGLAETIFDE